MLSMKVEGPLGSSIKDEIIPQMIRLASSLGVVVESELNGINVNACPGDSADRLWRAFEKAIQLNNVVKIAWSHMVSED